MKQTLAVEHTRDQGYPVPVDGIPLIRLTPNFVPFSNQAGDSSPHLPLQSSRLPAELFVEKTEEVLSVRP